MSGSDSLENINIMVGPVTISMIPLNMEEEDQEDVATSGGINLMKSATISNYAHTHT